MKSFIGRMIRLTLPLGLRSYLRRTRPTSVDPATWDREYATGQWETRFGALAEMPRYAVIAGYGRIMNPAASVLDIGCGDGHLLGWLCQGGSRRYVGIDVSSVAIQQARERASNSEARFEVADATTFVPDDQFDIIVLNEMLYYIEQPELVLVRCENFLAPGGVFIVSMCRTPESLRTWRRCAGRLKVLDEVRLRAANTTEWRVWLCRPQIPAF